jgi:hypothetical protein
MNMGYKPFYLRDLNFSKIWYLRWALRLISYRYLEMTVFQYGKYKVIQEPRLILRWRPRVQSSLLLSLSLQTTAGSYTRTNMSLSHQQHTL